MSKFLNPQYANIEVYTPGEQPRDMNYIKLNTNESPYPPSPGVIDAVNGGEASLLRLYSDPECKALKEALAGLYHVNYENVYVSNGSDDILNFAFMAFTSENVGAAFPEISYGFYKVYGDLHRCNYERIPLKEDFSIDADDYCNLNSLIVIANPNAPTGKFLPLQEVEKIIAANSDNVVLVDEAYVDFGGKSAIPLTKKYKNLLVVQTFSKSRSMAGARLGFAIGDKGLIEDLNRIKYSTNPYNVNRLTMAAGVAAIKDNDYYVENCMKICQTRQQTIEALEALDFHVIPSKANFILAKSRQIGGFELYTRLKERGILVRYLGYEKIKDYNRITIGTPEEMETFINTVKDILEEYK